MSGIAFIIVFILAVILMVTAISRWKIHPFLAIMGVSLLLALLAGIPLPQVADVIASGFSGAFSSVGIVIILGSLIGAILEKTGAALKLADLIIRLVGRKNPPLAIELMGWVVSIPIFCDSGFVILNPIRKAMTRHTGASSVAMTAALSAGLYTSTAFIPPAPGPIAAASSLGLSENLLPVMGLGVLCSVLPLTAGLLYARAIGKRIRSAEETDSEVVQTYEELAAAYGRLPGGFSATAPLLVPILLMALASVSSIAGWTGAAADLLGFLGKPIIALTAGTLCAAVLLARSGKGSAFSAITDETLKIAGPILFVIAAGSVLGRVLAASGIVDFIKANSGTLQTIGIFFPFLLAAILKSAQGSSTVAISTTAGIVAPLMEALGFTTPAAAALVVMAIGAGAMIVCHANDSYFWVVTEFGGLLPEQGYRV